MFWELEILRIFCQIEKLLLKLCIELWLVIIIIKFLNVLQKSMKPLFYGNLAVILRKSKIGRKISLLCP